MQTEAIKTETLTYRAADVAGYVNWIYFLHSWGFPPSMAALGSMGGGTEERRRWLDSLPDADRDRAMEAARLIDDAVTLIGEMGDGVRVLFKYALFAANSDGDNIVAGGTRLPFLRQQMPGRDGMCLCLADYIAPAGSGREDTLGVFAATIDGCGGWHDDYHRLLTLTVAERLVEAAVEKGHEHVRKRGWGYAPDEDLPMEDMLHERFIGIRPAVGYPSMPDQSMNFLIDRLLDLGSIGIRLTGNGAMSPSASVDGLMFANPHSRYFAIGKISQEQMLDYSRRRGIGVEELSKFLSKNTL